MTCLWHVRADCSVPHCHSVTFSPHSGEIFRDRPRHVRAANRIPDGSPKKMGWREAILFYCLLWIRSGTVVNDVPVARQSRDRPRRAARRESNPRWLTNKTTRTGTEKPVFVRVSSCLIAGEK